MVELLGEFQPHNVAIEMPFFNRTIKAAGGVLQAFVTSTIKSAKRTRYA